MNKRKTLRVAAFIGALGASAALIASAVGTTGAYFTDSKDGSLSGTSGHINIDVSGQNLAFSGLMPGEYQNKTVAYSTNSTGNSDVWMVFNPSNAAYQGVNDLGGFGHFEVLSNNGTSRFSSYNLKLDNGKSLCADNANGWGHNEPVPGYDYKPYPPNDPQGGLCAIPQAIKLDSNLPTGDYKFKVVFGLTPKVTDGENASWTGGTVPFKVVATQPGVSPTGDFIKTADKY